MKIKNGKLLAALDSPKFDLVNQIILLGYRGSIADGTYIPNRDGGIDDKDVIGMCVPPKEYYFGLDKFEQHERFREEWDVIVYSIAKYFRLLLKNNPNVMNLLWLPEKHYLFKNSYGQRIIDNRKIFVSKFAYKSFSGYAYGQLRRMIKYSGKLPTETAYLAGIFDGEGHVCIHKTRPIKETHSPIYFLEIGITNTDIDLIEMLSIKYGGNVGSTGIKDSNRLPAYRWRLSGPWAAKFLKELSPYLLVKKKQAEIGIAFQYQITVRKKGVPLTNDEVEQREEFRQILKKSRKDKNLSTSSIPESLEVPLYKTAYMGKRRKAFVEKYGYDTRNASCLIRLLKMGMEFLVTGELQVDRPEKHQLIEIKKGLWTLEQVKKRADQLFVGLEQAFIKSKLPNKPDYDRANKLLIEITEGCLMEEQNK